MKIDNRWQMATIVLVSLLVASVVAQIWVNVLVDVPHDVHPAWIGSDFIAAVVAILCGGIGWYPE